MDVFYEESAANQNAKKDGRKYKILNVFCVFFLVLWVIFLVTTVLFIPSWGMVILFGMQTLVYFGLWYLLRRWKFSYNVSYDYCFVSGELRISKVFNINRRKLMVRIDCEDMIQVGDIDNPSYDRFKNDPTTKEVVCTPNGEPAEGKFFMYVLANINGKKLYVLECRENLLMNIMKFVKRGVLESDYVMQERKQK